jgi:hypothetical protein
MISPLLLFSKALKDALIAIVVCTVSKYWRALFYFIYKV